jgi:hypothetical protein
MASKARGVVLLSSKSGNPEALGSSAGLETSPSLKALQNGGPYPNTLKPASMYATTQTDAPLSGPRVKTRRYLSNTKNMKNNTDTSFALNSPNWKLEKSSFDTNDK